jgi:hypothetical protein
MSNSARSIAGTFTLSEQKVADQRRRAQADWALCQCRQRARRREVEPGQPPSA